MRARDTYIYSLVSHSAEKREKNKKILGGFLEGLANKVPVIFLIS